ncbi:hypothetical protein ANANG_G00319780, partial [Anguilla anguilla]
TVGVLTHKGPRALANESWIRLPGPCERHRLSPFLNSCIAAALEELWSPLHEIRVPVPKASFDALSIPACPKVIHKLFKTRAPVVLGLLIGTGVLMFVTMACSRVLMKHIRKYESAPKHYN